MSFRVLARASCDKIETTDPKQLEFILCPGHHNAAHNNFIRFRFLIILWDGRCVDGHLIIKGTLIKSNKQPILRVYRSKNKTNCYGKYNGKLLINHTTIRFYRAMFW